MFLGVDGLAYDGVVAVAGCGPEAELQPLKAVKHIVALWFDGDRSGRRLRVRSRIHSLVYIYAQLRLRYRVAFQIGTPCSEDEVCRQAVGDVGLQFQRTVYGSRIANSVLFEAKFLDSFVEVVNRVGVGDSGIGVELKRCGE